MVPLEVAGLADEDLACLPAGCELRRDIRLGSGAAAGPTDPLLKDCLSL